MNNSKSIQGLDLASLGTSVYPKVEPNWEDYRAHLKKLFDQMFLPTAVYVDTEKAFSQEILGKLGAKKVEPAPGMHDIRDMKLMTLTGRYTHASPSCTGFPKFRSSLPGKLSIESTQTLDEEGTENMHSAATFNKFAVTVRPASQKDTAELYQTIQKNTPQELPTAEAVSNIYIYKYGKPHRLGDFHPLMVYEFHGDLREESLLLLGKTPLDQLAEVNLGYMFVNLYRSGYAKPLVRDADTLYRQKLVQICELIRRKLHEMHPEEKLFHKWTMSRSAVSDALLKHGLEGIFTTSGSMNLFRRRAKPLVAQHDSYSIACEHLVGYLFTEEFLMNNPRESWPKTEGFTGFHKLFKDLVGDKFLVRHPSYEDWWEYLSLKELIVV